jgi:hypothetical protein
MGNNYVAATFADYERLVHPYYVTATFAAYSASKRTSDGLGR